MPRFVLVHRHTAAECPVVFAAWNGFASPLRRTTTSASCASGGHEIWWDVDADDPASALALLPPFIARRTSAIPVDDVRIP